MFKKYLIIYLRIFAFTLQSKLTYRFNFFIELFYGPAYAIMLFIIVQTAFTKAPMLGGFTADEGLLLFSVFHLMYTIAIVFFIMGIRHFLWSGIRQGELDFLLTKPLNTQFMVSFTKPEFQQLLLLLGILALFVHQLMRVSNISILDFVLFLLLFMQGLMIIYFTLSTFATVGFFITRAQQVMELFDKVADNSQYPVNIYPTSFQILAVTIIPIAFFGYIPTLFLLGKGNLWLFLAPLFFLLIIIPINQQAWKIGLRHYSSASS